MARYGARPYDSFENWKLQRVGRWCSGHGGIRLAGNPEVAVGRHVLLLIPF